jgi:type II secretion system protein G
MTGKASQAFTLIELLIVVAIIAILAAIAVPNFLEAQVRAKVSRAHEDMRTIAVALESYVVDSNHYPPDSSGLFWYHGVPQATIQRMVILSVLTTPVAYLTSFPLDVFRRQLAGNAIPDSVLRQYPYYGPEDTQLSEGPGGWAVQYAPHRYEWSVWTFGPDRISNSGSALRWSMQAVENHWSFGVRGAIYDATNGTISRGDIVRCGP